MSEELNQPQSENQEVNSAEENQDIVENNQQSLEQTQQQTQPVEQPQERQNKDYSQVTEINEATEILNGKGINYDELQAEWDEKGELSDETYQKLEKAGITRDIADNYIEGRKAIVERTWDEIASVVGGRDEMVNIVEWASNNLSEAEIASIDSIRDANVIKIILQNLKNRMNDSEGILPQPIQGNSGDTTGNYFRSMAEVEEAINNPKYAKDEVYRNDIARKITASREAGILELK